jgi:spore coat-associated protein N
MKMKRFKVLFGQRRLQVLVALAALFLAVSVVIGSGASFTSTSANPSNVFTAGNLSHSNSRAGSAVLTASKMKPGDTATGSVTITNDGDIPGTFTLTTSNMTDAAVAPYTGKLSDVLTLTIMDGAVQIYSGPIKSLGSITLPGGAWAAGVAHTYDFTVTFPNGATPTGPTEGDNNYKKATMSIQFDWTSTS